jgi:hypothetical protein
MNKSIVLALIAGGATLGTGAAQAHDVSWSIGISTPVIGTVISNAPAYPAYRAYPAYSTYPVYSTYPAYSSYPVAYPVAYAAVPRVVVPRHAGYVRAVPVVVPRHHRHAWRHDHDRWNDDRGWRRD